MILEEHKAGEEVQAWRDLFLMRFILPKRLLGIKSKRAILLISHCLKNPVTELTLLTS